jgi:type VI secretion system protein ImpA
MSARWNGQLLEAITAEQPCGQSLDDTQLMASFDALRLFGQPTPLAPATEWGDIRNRAVDALGKSKDVRLLAFLATAALRTEGLPAFADTLTTAADWLERYWDHVFPLLDEDAIVRRNALNCFADPMAVVDGLRRLPLVSSRQHGTFTLRDLDMIAGQAQPADGETRPDESQVNAAFATMPLEDLQRQQQSAADALAALKRIEAAMSAHGGTDAVPDFRPLATQLGKIDRALRAQLGLRPGAGAAGREEPPAPSGGGVAAPAAVGAIRTREDAVRALDAVAEFFRRNEPSSPIPLFLERAKRLVAKDFLEVLADIAPDALPQARSAGGVTQSEY